MYEEARAATDHNIVFLLSFRFQICFYSSLLYILFAFFLKEYVCECMSMPVCMCVCVCVYACVYACVCACMCMCVCMCVCVIQTQFQIGVIK